MSAPLVSVIIPVHNRPVELKRAISSVLAQSYQEFEVYIIDDFSTFDIQKVIEEFNDPRLKYYRLPEKGNANVARNLGIEEAKGEYIAMLDSDDEFLPHHLERRLQKIKEWGCDGIFGSAKVLYKHYESYKISRKRYSRENMLQYLLTDGFAPTPSHFYIADKIKKVRWNESLHRHQDFDLSLKFSMTNSFVADPEPTIIIHWENGSVKYDFESQIAFIDTYKHLLDRDTHIKYFMHMLSCARKNSANRNIINYYKTNSLKYIKYLSLSKYMEIMNNPKRPFNFFYKLNFSIRNLF